MSAIHIEIPDDRWFRGEWDFRPKDKQLCVVIGHDYRCCTCQYIENDEVLGDCFLSIDMRSIYRGVVACRAAFVSWKQVDRWKPLGLPADVEERVIAEIEYVFGKGEENG